MQILYLALFSFSSFVSFFLPFFFSLFRSALVPCDPEINKSRRICTNNDQLSLLFFLESKRGQLKNESSEYQNDMIGFLIPYLFTPTSFSLNIFFAEV